MPGTKKKPSIPLRPLALCLSGGLLLALCLPKPGLCFLAWCAPAVLLYFAREAADWRRAALLGFLFGIGFCGLALNWIYFTCRFAGVPLPIAALAMLALAAFLALNWALHGVLVRWAALRLPVWALPWAWALFWAALESASARWSPRVGVDLLAYTQWRYLPLIQIGAVLGPHALGALVVLWNGALAELVRSVPRPKTRGTRLRRRLGPWRTELKNAAAAGVLLALCGLYGAGVLSDRSPAPAGDEGARVEILQPNIDQYQKWDVWYAGDVRLTYERLLKRSRERPPDLVIWPESALPGWLDEPGGKDWLARWARALPARMVAGAVTRMGARRHNSAVLLGVDGELQGLYHKRQLVPFGEFVPFRPLFEGWVGILAQMGDMDAGAPEQPLWETPAGTAAVNICYEAVFPHLLRPDSARGARVFINVTNDGWYKDTWGPYQHFQTNVFRAVENRVTVLRAANTGISGAIDPYGVVLARTGLGTRTRLDLALPRTPGFPKGSLYARTGDWLGLLAILAAVALLLGSAARRR